MRRKSKLSTSTTGRSRALPAKLTQPQLVKVLARTRLFDLLDAVATNRAVWVEGAPGAGKTTLAVSWLEARKRPCIWYQVDSGDIDLPTFFHYLGIAVGQAAPHAPPIPHLTPEYLGSVETFARRFFEEVFRRLPGEAVLVFDNVQDAGSDTAALHGILRVAVESTPPCARILFLSRSAPPAALMRLHANGVVSIIEPQAMRLTLEESKGVAALRGISDAHKVAAMHEHAVGWTAGLVLMLEHPSSAERAPDVAHPESLFGYFAGEVLDRLDEDTRKVLLRCAILPKMHTADVESLADTTTVERCLADLAQRNYFTYRLTPRGGLYEFHPLFREFLLTRLRQSVGPQELSRIRLAAAQLLDRSGAIEDAADLWLAAEHWDALIPHILKTAPGLMAAGRAHVVAAWLDALPAKRVELEPWLLYWRGICRLAFDPTAARPVLEQAFERFEHSDDIAGAYEAWASVVDTFVYEWSNFTALDRWLEAFERLQRQCPEFPSPPIEVHVASSVFNALMWRNPSHPDLPRWADRVKRLTLESADARFRVVAGNHLALYYLWMGQFASATAIIEALRPTLRTAKHDPLVRMTLYVMEAMHAWFTADAPACVAAVEAGGDLARESGIHLHDLYLYAQAVYCGLSLNEPDIAATYLHRMAGVDTPRRTDHALLLYQMAAAACSRGDFALAIEHGTAAASIAAETGAPLLDGFCHTELSFFLYRAGRGEEARLALTRGRRSAVGMNFVECLGLLYEAWFCLGQRQEGEAIPPLRSALALASRQGYSNFPHWDSLMMSTLCAFALAQSIEPDYVRSLIRKRNLAPPDPRTILETWPWPVRIHVLGQFKLEAAEALSVNTRKASRKPLELLGLLIASGTGGISIERAAEALWSTDRDGNGGEALRVALYRLRRMLGGEARILTAEGRLILNERYCWVDAWRFERVLDAATTPSKSPAALPKAPISNAVLESALALYHGPFAPDEVRGAWALAYRERLHGLFVRAALELGMRFESEVPIEHAIAFYERVLQVDDLVEAFYQRLLACYGALGRRAEGLGVYARCQKRLRAGLGVTPSERTEALKTALLAGERPHVRSVSSNR